MIVGRAIRKRFGRHQVLDALDFEIGRGERVAILGLNGSGKTTLFRCILGLIPFEGSLAVNGRTVTRSSYEARRMIGYVPQKAPSIEGSLAEFVNFFSDLRGANVADIRDQLSSLDLSLAEHGTRRLKDLSGGMLQKALLALAVGAGVPVLLLDEPTANLDARARKEFVRAVNAAGADTTVLLASHRLRDVEAVANRVVVLHQGRFVFSGTLDELWARVGVSGTLWIEVPPEIRAAVADNLRASLGAGAVGLNGKAVSVQVERGRRADVVRELRENDIPILDFWTETPGLESILDRLVAGQRGRS